VPNLRHTNVVIGAYVTADARIHLYSFLDRLQENAIYCDPYSVIFIQPSAEPWPIANRGTFNLNCNLLIHTRIFEWESKNYAYRVITNDGEKTVC